MLEEYLVEPINAVVPDHVTHIGFIASDYDGNFVVSTSSDSKSGTTATFPKERIVAGLSAVPILNRCLAQYEDPHVKGIYPVPVVGVTPTSTTFYFAGTVNRQKDHWQAAKGQLGWHSPERVVELLKASKNPASKHRDLAVFKAVSQMCLSPHHRVLLMLRELHKMGFERLRAPAYDGGVAWRCPIVPAAWTLKTHGGKFRDPRTKSAPLPQLRKQESNQLQYVYSAAYEQRPFNWDGVAFFTPRQLAERFLIEFPDIATCGWGPDADYVRWFESVLQMIHPYGLYAAFGDYFYPEDHVKGPDNMKIPLPPPGHTDERELESFIERFSPKSEE